MDNETEMSASETSRKAHAKFDEAEEDRRFGNFGDAKIKYKEAMKLFEGIDWHMVWFSASWVRHLEKRE